MESQLLNETRGFGPRCSDRVGWQKIKSFVTDREIREYKQTVDRAMPEWSNETYLEYSQTGSRLTGEAMMKSRKLYLISVMMTECLEWNGAYVGAPESALREIALQPTFGRSQRTTRIFSFGIRGHLQLRYIRLMLRELLVRLYIYKTVFQMIRSPSFKTL